MFLLLLALASPFSADLDKRVAEINARPEAIAPLERLLDLQDAVPRAEWEAALAKLEKLALHPLVRARLELALAEVDDDHGRAGDKRRAALGVIDKWRIAGPYDNEGRKGFDAAYPPEKGAKEVAWREARAVRGVLSFDAYLRPDTNRVGYAEATLELAGDVALRVGSTGAIKVWVDGKPVIAHDVYRPLHIDQDVGAVHLAKGKHRILVKVGVTEGAWAFIARVTHEKTPADFAKLLRARARAEWLVHYAPDDPEDRTAETAMREACEGEGNLPPCLLRLAEVSTQTDEKRQALERAIDTANDKNLRARAEALLGDTCAQARRDRCAEEKWRAALKDDPEWFPAAIRLAELLADRGLGAAGEKILSEWVAKAPDVPRVVAAWARLEERRGKRAEAEKAYERLLASVQSEDLLRERYGFARVRGDAQAALASAQALAKLRPDATAYRFDTAELQEALGQADAAAETLRGLCLQLPDDPRAWEKLGRLLARRGDKAGALTALRKTIELRPQSPDVRDLVERLEPKNGSDLPREFARDVKAVIKAAKDRKWPGESAVVLFDGQTTRVHQNGLSTVYAQRIVQVLDDRGVRDENEQAVRYTPDSQSVEIRAARVYKPSGAVWEASARDDRDLSEPWYGMYYDVRAQVVRFDRLEPGDVIDFEYVLSDVGRRNLFADYFGDVHFFQEDMPRVESAYTLLAPASRPLYFNQPKLAGITHREEARGAEKLYEWRVKDAPKIEVEPGMPGWSEAAGYLHVSTYKAWEEVAAWYWGLVRDQLAMDQVMRDAVHKAAEGAKTELDKVRAVHDLVVKSTRYVGLEFGIHGYQPYRTTQVYARKFGDCKDKASLLVVFLREVGIEAKLVIVRTRRGGDLDSYPASLAVFDHAIAYVPKYDLWLDGTAEWAGTTELPSADQGVPVLVVDSTGHGKLVRTPVYTADHNKVARKETWKLTAGGAARGHEDLSISGQAAPEWREHYQAAGDRRERYEKAWNARLPGAHVTAVEMPDIGDRERPVEVRAEVEAPRLGRPAGGAAWALPATARESELARSYARLSSRRYDLVLAYPWEQQETFQYELPKGWRAQRLPATRKLETPFGQFELSAEADGGKVTVTTHLVVSKHRVSKGDYAGFRRFLLDVDAALNQEIVAGP